MAIYLILAAVFGAGALYNLYLLLQGRSVDVVGPLLIVCLLVTGFCLIMAMSTR